MGEDGPKPMPPDSSLPPEDLTDPGADEGDIPEEVKDAAKEAEHDVTDDD